MQLPRSALFQHWDLILTVNRTLLTRTYLLGNFSSARLSQFLRNVQVPISQDFICRISQLAKMFSIFKFQILFISVSSSHLTKIKNLLCNNEIIESCTREWANTKFKFYKLTNVTIFAALLKEVPRGCKDTIDRFTIEESLRQMFNIWGKNPGAVQWRFTSL